MRVDRLRRRMLRVFPSRLLGGGEHCKRRAMSNTRWYSSGGSATFQPNIPLAWLQAQVLNPTLGVPLDTPDLVDQCRERLMSLPLNGKVAGVVPPHQLTSPQLAMYLGENWLDDEMLNAGAKYVLHHAAVSHPHVAIADTLHVSILSTLRTRPSSADTTSLALDIQSGRTTIVYFPLHVNSNHWTLLEIDIMAQTFSYADCLHHLPKPPQDQFDTILSWLQLLKPEVAQLTRVPFTLTLPRQQDSSSCGIIVLSLLSSILLQTEMWSSEQASAERMIWFLRLTPSLESASDSDYPVSLLPRFFCQQKY